MNSHVIFWHQRNPLYRHLRTGNVYRFHLISVFNNSTLRDKSYYWWDKGTHDVLFFRLYTKTYIEKIKIQWSLWIAYLALNVTIKYCCCCVFLACSLFAYIFMTIFLATSHKCSIYIPSTNTCIKNIFGCNFPFNKQIFKGFLIPVMSCLLQHFSL